MLGYGINAFFDAMISLMYMFLVISAFLIPVYIMYSGSPDKGMINMDPSAWKYALARFTMGNLGGA